MAYTKLNRATPAGTQAGTAVPVSARENLCALADGIIFGALPDYLFSVSVGSGSAEEPQYLYWTNSSANIKLRATLTWGTTGGEDGNIKQMVLDLSINGGTDYTTAPGGNICTIVNSYDSNGYLTSSTGGGGMLAFIGYLLGRHKTLWSLVSAHAASSGTSVHGLGTISTQAANNVSITGGTISGVALDFNTARGKVVNLGSMSGSVAIDWAAGDYFYGTIAGVTTLSWSNLPSGKAGSVTLELTNPGAYSVTWPTGVKWPAGTAPSRTSSGVDLYEFVCRDGTTVRGAQAMKDSR